MPIRMQLLPDYVHVAWHGNLSSLDLDELSAELPRIGQQIGRSPDVLHTFDEVKGMGLQGENLAAYGRHLEKIKLPNPTRSASVCGNPLAYGMARMMQMFNQNPDLQIEVFSDMPEALRWLKGQAKAGGKAEHFKS